MCRDAQDGKRDIPVPLSPSLVATAYYASAALRPCRFATPLLRSALATQHSHKWLDGVSDALAYGLRRFAIARTYGHTPAPSLRSMARSVQRQKKLEEERKAAAASKPEKQPEVIGDGGYPAYKRPIGPVPLIQTPPTGGPDNPAYQPPGNRPVPPQ